MTAIDEHGNVVRREGFSQVVIWCGTIVGQEKVQDFEQFMLSEIDVRVQYLEEVTTAPDQNQFGNPVKDTGGRNDVLFAVHKDDITKFAVRRFTLDDHPRWIEDVFGNGGGYLYPDRIAKYKTWQA